MNYPKDIPSEAIGARTREAITRIIMQYPYFTGPEAKKIADAILSLSGPTREETIEECAEIADNFPDSILQLVDRQGGTPGNYLRGIKGRDIASAIRQLASVSRPDRGVGR